MCAQDFDFALPPNFPTDKKFVTWMYLWVAADNEELRHKKWMDKTEDNSTVNKCTYPYQK